MINNSVWLIPKKKSDKPHNPQKLSQKNKSDSCKMQANVKLKIKLVFKK